MNFAEAINTKYDHMLKVLYKNALTSAQTDNIPAETLGALCFAQIAEKIDTKGNSTFAHVAMPCLGGENVLYEFLQTIGPIQSGQNGDVRFKYNDKVLFGVITLDESKFSDEANTPPLQLASKAAYEQIFATLESQDFPYVLRFWNYMADINRTTHALERYRQFNLGRQQAFSAKGQEVSGNVPAACALGTMDGPLTIAFLAGRTASLPIENPRQVSAYDYPAQYGPRSPLFSRASLASVAATNILFLSGTASIVGHQTLHAGDVIAQTEESIANIAAVLEVANQKASKKFKITDLDYIVYIRNPEHFLSVSSVLKARIGPNVKATYVQADICRSDLLVEIEGSVEQQ